MNGIISSNLNLGLSLYLLPPPGRFMHTHRGPGKTGRTQTCSPCFFFCLAHTRYKRSTGEIGINRRSLGFSLSLSRFLYEFVAIFFLHLKLLSFWGGCNVTPSRSMVDLNNERIQKLAAQVTKSLSEMFKEKRIEEDVCSRRSKKKKEIWTFVCREEDTQRRVS